MGVPLLLVGVCTARLQHQLFADFEALKQELESSMAVEGKMRAESNLVEADFEAAAASPPPLWSCPCMEDACTADIPEGNWEMSRVAATATDDTNNEFCTDCGHCVQMICGNDKYQWNGMKQCSGN